MIDVRDVLRLVQIGVNMYHSLTPIVLDDQNYLAVGEVQDLGSSYVCLRLDSQNLACRVLLLTLRPDENTYDMRDIEPDEQLATGSERQSIDCTMVSSFVAATFRHIQERVPPTMEDRYRAIQTFARNVLLRVWAAGIFTGKHAYDETVAFGAHIKLPPPARRSESDHIFATLRRGCVPGDKFGILAYAELLVATKAYEMLYEPDKG